MAAPFVVLSAMVAARRFLNLSPTFRGLLAMPRTGETRSPDSRPARGAAGRSAGSDAGLWLYCGPDRSTPTDRLRRDPRAAPVHAGGEGVHDRRLSWCRTQ